VRHGLNGVALVVVKDGLQKVDEVGCYDLLRDSEKPGQMLFYCAPIDTINSPQFFSP